MKFSKKFLPLLFMLFVCSVSFAGIPDPNEDEELIEPDAVPIDSSIVVLLVSAVGFACYQFHKKSVKE